MDSSSTGIAVLALLGVVGVALAAALHASWRRANRAGGLQLFEALKRRGLAPEDAADERALAVAVRRCALCADLEACRHWLAGKGDDPAAFCPNTTYLDNLERAKRRATAQR